MAVTFKILICDLSFEFTANADIFRCSLDPAGAVAAVFPHNFLQAGNYFGIRIEFYIFRQLHKISFQHSEPIRRAFSNAG